MKTKGQTKGQIKGEAAGRRLFAIAAILFAVILFSGCAVTMNDVQGKWQQVSAEYPGCKDMPKIVFVEYDKMLSWYTGSSHTVYLDKYASNWVIEHELRHACGDTLGEKGVVYNIGKVASLKK